MTLARRAERELARGHRLADEVALGEVAPEVAQQVERRAVLDALGDHAQAHGVAEVDRRADELQVALLAVGAEAGDERAVELELAHGEVAQVRERGVAGAEVVDRDEHADVAERA